MGQILLIPVVNTSISTGIDGPGSPSILVAKSSILDKSSMDALFTVNCSCITRVINGTTNDERYYAENIENKVFFEDDDTHVPSSQRLRHKPFKLDTTLVSNAKTRGDLQIKSSFSVLMRYV